MSTTPGDHPDVASEFRFLTLDQPRWYGAARRSPNGQWMISWRESGYVVARDGTQTRPKGAWLLYEPTVKRVACKGSMTRPTEGAVANNGAFVLVDMSLGDALESTLHAFDGEGNRLLRKKLHALIMTTAISDSGRYALCLTANSPDGDGHSMFLFDLKTGSQVFATSPVTAWTSDYLIDEARGEVVAHVKKLGSFRYDSTGRFLDAEALEEATLTHGEYSSVFFAAERILETRPSPERVRQVLAALHRAFEEGGNRDPAWKAVGLKMKGIAHQSLGETEAAIAAYEQALAINDKIGVKRRLTVLLKRKG